MFSRLSDLSRYQRFFSYSLAGPRQELAYLGSVDGHERLALVAEAGDGRVVGMARFHRLQDGHADVAVVVEDAFQHHGVGRRLMAELSRAARREGVTIFDVEVLGDNVDALRLLRSLAPHRQLHLESGVFETRVSLAG